MTNKKHNNLINLKNILKLDGILEEDYNFWKQIYHWKDKLVFQYEK